MDKSPGAPVSRGCCGAPGERGAKRPSLTVPGGELLSWAVLVRVVRDTEAQWEGGPSADADGGQGRPGTLLRPSESSGVGSFSPTGDGVQTPTLCLFPEYGLRTN